MTLRMLFAVGVFVGILAAAAATALAQSPAQAGARSTTTHILDDMSPDMFSMLGRKDFGGRIYAHARLALNGEDTRPVWAPGRSVSLTAVAEF